MRRGSRTTWQGRLEVPHKGSTILMGLKRKMEKIRIGSFAIFICYKGVRSPNERILMLTVSSLRDVLEMKVSSTAVYHFVMNSSSNIRSLCK
jgi:hypothetical protein